MNALQRFENFMERMLEGSFSRLFRSSVQPAEVARRIERAMESNVTISVGHHYTPNHFQVRLHPEDYKAFAPYRARLEREMIAFVRETAQERGWELLAAPRVTLSENAEIPRHAIEVDSQLVDTGGPAAESAVEIAEYQPTTAMPIMRPAAPTAGPPRSPVARPAQPPATVRLLSGHQAGSVIRLTAPLTTLGRELDNDLVIEDSRVSRHHAQVLFQHNRYAVRDLDTTNGTFVNGQQVQTGVLANGDRISLGGFELQFML
ncbi:MAG TPA: DUF3662 and FHA domain-containing protein [Chloroflexia bacterium]|nr:DUF3662 and FHA domain-containing protein [Chloroflexia bacterium]